MKGEEEKYTFGNYLFDKMKNKNSSSTSKESPAKKRVTLHEKLITAVVDHACYFAAVLAVVLFAASISVIP